MQRLRTRVQIQTVLSERPVARTGHFALHRSSYPMVGAPLQADASQPLFPAGIPSIGVIIPKRWAKRAVTRNLLKRLIRQVTMLHEDQLASTAHVIRLRAAFDTRVYASAASPALREVVSGELRELLRLGSVLNKTASQT